MSRSCHGHVTVMSRSYHDHVTAMSRSCHGHVTVMSRSCHGYVMVMSRSCNGYVTVMSRSCHGHVTVMSRSCQPSYEFCAIAANSKLNCTSLLRRKSACTWLRRRACPNFTAVTALYWKHFILHRSYLTRALIACSHDSMAE